MGRDNYAIVIGIDNYISAPILNASVNDALIFSEWALNNGEVPPDNLYLLLSPLDGRKLDIPFTQATNRNIKDTIKKIAGMPGKRLFFYFAGHGLTPPSASFGAEGEPVIIPADYQPLEKNVIGFSEIISALSRSGPAEQFFFIDACRNFVSNIESQGIRTNLPWWPKLNSQFVDYSEPNKQYIIFSTSLGKQSLEGIEEGAGVFTPSLIEALGGKGRAKVWSELNGCYEVRFSSLSAFIRSSIQEKLDEIYSDHIQLPDGRIIYGETDPNIITIENVKDIELSVHVYPIEARDDFNLQAWRYLDGNRREVVSSDGAPGHDPYKIQVPPGDYILLGQAKNFEGRREVTSLYDSKELTWQLDRSLIKPALKNGISYTKIDNTPEYYELTGKLSRGRIIIYNENSSAFIKVLNSKHQTVLFDYQNRTIDTREVDPGIYYIEVNRPEKPPEYIAIEVRPAKVATLSVDAHLFQSNEPYGASNIETRNRISVSFLSNAALAMNLPNWDRNEYELSNSIGIKSFVDIRNDNLSSLLVLLAVADPAAATVIVRDYNNQVEYKGNFELLSGLTKAGQIGVKLKPGTKILELYVPGEKPLYFAISCVEGGLTVFAAAKEYGSITVRQHIVMMSLAYQWRSEVDMRVLDIIQSYYINRKYIPVENDLARLIIPGKLELADPLLGCLAGYYLLRLGRKEIYHMTETIKNMISLPGFREIPDSHILAGLYDKANQSEHFLKALNIGLPVFSDGFHVLNGWVNDRTANIPGIFKAPREGLLPNYAWTAWSLPDNI
jgi:hypothetical protein